MADLMGWSTVSSYRCNSRVLLEIGKVGGVVQAAVIIAVACQQQLSIHKRKEWVAPLFMQLPGEGLEKLGGRHTCISNIGNVFYLALKYDLDGPD